MAEDFDRVGTGFIASTLGLPEKDYRLSFVGTPLSNWREVDL